MFQICEELNTPLIPHVKKWTGHRGQWRYLMSHNSGQDEEYLGFIYDASQEIEVVRSSLVQTGNSAACPFMVHFKVKQHPLVSINVHNPCSTDQTRLHSEIMSTLPSILETLEQKSPGTKDVIILGNFNLGPGAKEFSLLKDNGYVHTVAEGCFTDISLENMAGAATCDNIWLSKQAQAGYTGHSKVVREGLTSVWIPNGWAWGGLATDHCPVWAEFYTDSSVGLEDVDLIER
ncbi:endonuclease/exonuclease/phosphatase family domain-containing protein 1 [Lingula anatina]|uniref:Endonuclease/exonuclease/phosphatase family domain-containing protein 1 n=1 Tax=Lingula anatina TaxID=7574 RepID=A0A1S3HCL1_LINAN|nr:endonuclease/exonuclease/phosphatase family domain-containing protein 1 [Lingula anatina]|eukprot:XP_013383772.1 endonuclease/exonuclease/phosphatase family domain-containing protein 1 [Lingula anatina]